MPDLSDCFDTKTAGERLMLEPGKLRSFLTKRPDLSPAKIGSAMVWTDADVERIRSAMDAEEKGLCPHCGKQIRAPKADPEPPAESGG